MPIVREADLEEGNPGLTGKTKNKQAAAEDEKTPRSTCTPAAACRKGWIWAVLVAGILMGTIIPLGLRDRRQPSTGVPDYSYKGQKQLNTTILFDPMAGPNSTQALTCAAVQADLPNATIPESSPPPAVKLLGSRMVTADGGKDINIHGINWFGFNNGKTMVDGLDGETEKKHTWEGGDFATIVQQLKLLGFNAVRLPFLFGNLYTLPPQDYTKKCPDKQPTAEALAQRTTNPKAPKPAAAAPALSKNINPPGSQPGVCNAYLPMGASTMARFLWVVQFFVANGFYVLIDYHPEPGNVEPITDSVETYTHNWLKLWTGLTCLPNWGKELQGRVFLDLMNEPDGVNITWAHGAQGNSSTNLGDYYLSAMDAINKQSKGQDPIYFIQGSGQEKAGSNWGDGFVTDKQRLEELKMADPNPFFTALADKPYKNKVVLSPHLYGPSLSNNTYHVGAPQWKNYASSWGTLQKQGYCANGTSSCQAFPVVIGETGSNFTHPADTEYFDSLGKFMRMSPPADSYPTTRFNRWFWWVYNANSKEVGGLVGRDWHTLDWKKLAWMQGNLGLTPWYKQEQSAAAAAAPAAAPATAPAAPAAPAAAAAPAPK